MFNEAFLPIPNQREVDPIDEQSESREQIAFESRFCLPGKMEQLLNTMQNGKVEILGTFAEVFPELGIIHANEVSVSNINKVVPVVFTGEKPEDTIQGIFKPFEGEDAETKERAGFESFYLREVAVFLISQHFDFDLVPPTVIREVEGKIDSLQLCMDNKTYLPAEYVEVSDDDYDQMRLSNDYKLMAVFDFIIANTDRKEENYLVKAEGQLGTATPVMESGEPVLIAIDNGSALKFSAYTVVSSQANFQLRGPSLDLTSNPQKRNEPGFVDLEEPTLELLKKGLAEKEVLDRALTPLYAAAGGIDPMEIEYMWQRVEALIVSRTILSKNNISTISNNITTKYQNPHPPFSIRGF